MLYKHKLKFLPVFMVVAILLATATINISLAASITGMTDTMTNQTVGAFSNHTIKFTTPTGASDASETIIVTFPSDFDLTNIAIADVTFSHGATTGLETAEVIAATATASAWGLAFSGTQNRVLTFTAPSDGVGAATVAAADKIVLTLTNTTGDEVKNPTVANSYTIAISGTFDDTGSFAVPIIADGSIDITATVDPTLTFSLSAVTCALGTLTSANKQTCQYNVTVSTNATGGYTGYIKDDGNLRNATDDIGDVADASVTTGAEEYGVATSDTTSSAILTAQGSTAVTSGDCTSADATSGSVAAAPLTTTNQTFTANGTPVSSDVTTLCHAASITGVTPAGSYASIATITVVGNF